MKHTLHITIICIVVLQSLLYSFPEEVAPEPIAHINLSNPESNSYAISDTQGNIAAHFQIKNPDAQTLQGSIIKLPINPKTSCSAIVENISSQLQKPLTLSERSLLTSAFNKAKDGQGWDYVNKQLEDIAQIPGRKKLNETNLIQALKQAETPHTSYIDSLNSILSIIKTQIGHIINTNAGELSANHSGVAIEFSPPATQTIKNQQAQKAEIKKQDQATPIKIIPSAEPSFLPLQNTTQKINGNADVTQKIALQTESIIKEIKTPQDAKKKLGLKKTASNKESEKEARRLIEILCSFESKANQAHLEAAQNTKSLFDLICPAVSLKPKKSSDDTDLKILNALLQTYGLPQITPTTPPNIAQAIKNNLMQILNRAQKTLEEAISEEVSEDINQALNDESETEPVFEE